MENGSMTGIDLLEQLSFGGNSLADLLACDTKTFKALAKVIVIVDTPIACGSISTCSVSRSSQMRTSSLS